MEDLPDHLELPCSDGVPDDNFHRAPQAWLLSSALLPTLSRLHPAGDYMVGSNSAIYWKLTADYWSGVVAPDWYYVPGAPARDPRGRNKRSLVMWHERSSPLIVMEFISNDHGLERDRTPEVGKYWIYENAVRARYYAILDGESDPNTLAVYTLSGGSYIESSPDALGRYPIPELGVSLGLWDGKYMALDGPWLRWFDDTGAPAGSGTGVA